MQVVVPYTSQCMIDNVHPLVPVEEQNIEYRTISLDNPRSFAKQKLKIKVDIWKINWFNKEKFI